MNDQQGSHAGRAHAKKLELIRQVLFRSVKTTVLAIIAVVLFSVFMGNVPLKVALLGALALLPICGLFFSVEAVCFVLLEAKTWMLGSVLGAVFAIIAFLIWAWAFGGQMNAITAAEWAVLGAVFGALRARRLRRRILIASKRQAEPP